MYKRKNKIWFLKGVNSLIVFVFLIGQIGMSSIVAADTSQAYLESLPAPQQMVHSSDKIFQPLVMKGLEFSLEEPLRFTFYLDSGNTDFTRKEFQNQAQLLIKYFLTALTTRDKDLWVNLNPEEKDRISPEPFGQTELGRDLLAQDYLLKQLSSSLIYPEEKIGQEFWKKIYQNIPGISSALDGSINTLNRVWIVPEQAMIYRKGNKVLIANCRLKVLSVEDYLVFEQEAGSSQNDVSGKIAQDAFKDIIIPQLEKEINEGESFAVLRQIYHSVILAEWYKKHLQDTFLGANYAEKNKTRGLNSAEVDIKHKIYDRYAQAYQKGIYNYIREDFDPVTQDMVPRQYFSGGVKLTNVSSSTILGETNHFEDVAVNGDMYRMDGVFELRSGDRNSSGISFLKAQESLSAASSIYIEQIIEKSSSSLMQDDLPREYFLRVDQMAKGLLDYIRDQGNLSAATGGTGNILKDVATGQLIRNMLTSANIKADLYFSKKLNRKNLNEQQKAVLERADAILQQLKSYGKTSRWYFADFGTVIAAFLGEQAIYGQDYFNIYLPRDMGYGYTIQRTLSNLESTDDKDAGMFYLSRASFGQEYYDWFKQNVLSLLDQVDSKEEFMAQITGIVKDRMDKDKDFKERLEQIKDEIDRLGYGAKSHVRFIDSSTGRFPTLFQVIFKIYYPNVETKGLVIESFDQRLLPQLDTKQWRQSIQDQISEDHGMSQILVNKIAALIERTPAGSGQTTKAFFHPVEYDEETHQLHASPMHETLMADWISMAFMMGTSRYYLMVKALQDNLVQQGMEVDKAKLVTVKVIARIVGDSQIQEDKSGLTEAVVATNSDDLSRGMVDKIINDVYRSLGGQKSLEFQISPSLLSQILPKLEVEGQQVIKRNIKSLIVGLVIALGVAVYGNYDKNDTAGPDSSIMTQPVTVQNPSVVSQAAIPFVHANILTKGSKGPAFEEFKARVFATWTIFQLIDAVGALSDQINPLTGKTYGPQFKENAQAIVERAHQSGSYDQNFENLVVGIQSRFNIRPDGDVGPETRDLVKKTPQVSLPGDNNKSSSAVGGIAFSRDVTWIREVGLEQDLFPAVISSGMKNFDFDGLAPIILTVDRIDLAAEMQDQ
ncbi:MAG: hypothetical protein H6753_02930 [Candidatus Omnitrophica bacterium]|nr:hypothetical protein [Candidatus Omnitrophota bacterium]